MCVPSALLTPFLVLVPALNEFSYLNVDELAGLWSAETQSFDQVPILGCVISQSVVHLFMQPLYTRLWLAGVHYKKYMTCKTIYQLPKDSSNMNPNDKVNMIYLV
jgi:hypothetical protein